MNYEQIKREHEKLQQAMDHYDEKLPAIKSIDDLIRGIVSAIKCQSEIISILNGIVSTPKPEPIKKRTRRSPAQIAKDKESQESEQ